MSDNRVERRIRLLVVEDNPIDIDLLCRALSDAELDCELIVIDDGAKALDFARSAVEDTVPDLAVIDLNLPKHDGIEVLRELRARQVFAEMPVLLLSSSPYVTDPINLEYLRVDRFAAKPLDYDEYLKIGHVVRNMLTEQARRFATHASPDVSS